jgi:hypothetical protein
MKASKSEEVILEAATATHWYKVCLTVGNGMAEEEAIQSEFSRLYSDHSAPREAALFCALLRTPLTGNDLYFSPRAGQIASYLVARYAGKICSVPEPSGLELLVGGEGWREILFSQEQTV